jgi:hypothetical protein
LSDLEKQFELEMEDYNEPSGEAEENDLQREFELEMEDYNEPSGEAEDYEPSGEAEDPAINDLGQKFFELSQQQFTSENEVDSALNGLLNEVERQFFFKKLIKKGLGKKLLKLGGNLVKRLPAFQGLKAITQLARGDLKGLVGSLAKSGLASAIPGGAAILPAIQSIGLSETAEDLENNPDLWQNFVRLSENAYDNLANNLNEYSMKNPVYASRVATQAFQDAAATVKKKAKGSRYPAKKKYSLSAQRGDVIHLRIRVL